MPEKLLEAFHKTTEALQAAIADEVRSEITILDKQVQNLFEEILQVAPDTSAGRKQLIQFLLDHCCTNSVHDRTVQSAKDRIMALI